MVKELPTHMVGPRLDGIPNELIALSFHRVCATTRLVVAKIPVEDLEIGDRGRTKDNLKVHSLVCRGQQWREGSLCS